MIGSAFRKLYSPDKELFYFNTKFLFIVGLWPDEKWPKYATFLYRTYDVFLFCGSLIYLAITAIGTYQQKGDLIVVLTNLDKTLVAYQFTIKIILFSLRRRQIKILINEIIESGDYVTDELKRNMILHALVTSAISTTIAGVFCIISLYKNEIIIDAWLPFDPLESRKNLIISFQINVSLYGPCSFRANAMQGLVCGILMYICDQMVELQQRIRNLSYTPETEQEMRENFKMIIKKHVRIMGYARSMTDIFKEYFLIQNLAVTLELCFNAIMVNVVGLEQKTVVLTFICFLFAALMNAYIYCYLGEQMIAQSTGISLAAYEAEWTKWPIDLQKQLLIVLRMAQRPLQLSAGGMANMSLQTYSQALYNGYSIFAVLNDAVD